MIANNSITDKKKDIVRVAIYTRKSNDENLNGNVTSIDSQKAACRAYINIQKEKGWQEYPEAFDDPAESGKDLNRPAIKRLLQRIQEGKVDAVIVYKLDRLTRNSKDFHNLVELFEKHDVAFVSATESLDTKSPQGRLMVNIMVQFAQYDRELDQERSRDFHLARARKGLWCAGLPPLGYDIKDKLLVVNEEEANLVRKIFDLYLKHQSVLKVTQELNVLGYKRKAYQTKEGKILGGRRFDIKSILRILQRKVYIGLITNNRTNQDFPGQHQPIISPAVFKRVQELLESHARRDESLNYQSNKHGFKLKGLVRCGECQSIVVGYIRPKRKTGKIYRYYRCQGRANGIIKCSITSIGAEKLEEYVIEKLATLGWDKPLLERVVEKVKSLSKTYVSSLEKEKQELQMQLNTIRTEIEKTISLLKKHPSNKELNDEMDRLDDSKKTLEIRVSELAAETGYRNQAVYDVDVIQRAFQHFARFIYKLPLEQQIHIIHLMVKQIWLFKDSIKVELHELPIVDLQKALNTGHRIETKSEKREGGAEQFKSHRLTTTGLEKGTAVVELPQKWRGRRDLNPRSSP